MAIAMETTVIKLVLAIILGALVGYQREIKGKPAGLRTHMLICFGSALFTIVSLSFSPEDADVSRIASGVVTGVGFLGAGSIFRAKDHVEGLTTAADLWVVSGIGLAVGIGAYDVAVMAALLALVVLFLRSHFEKK